MVAALLLSFGLLGAGDREAYEAAKAQAGRDPDAHVKLALWCEQHGMTAQRAKHLALAVLIDPKNRVARGLMGFVQFQGNWRRPDAVAVKVKADVDRAVRAVEYGGRRARAPHTADGQWKLALWCEENGLIAEATAHFSATVRHDPSHAAARKRLGYKKQGRRWVTETQLVEEKAQADAQRKAERLWKPRFTRWRTALADKAKREATERALEAVTDPRAVSPIWDVFVRGNENDQATAVRLFGQIEGPRASHALALLAVASRWPIIRQRATETLRRRDSREYLDLLVGMVRDPIQFEVRPGKAPGQFGEVFIKGKRANTDRVYQIDQDALVRMLNWLPPRLFGPNVPLDPTGSLSLSMVAASSTPPGPPPAAALAAVQGHAMPSSSQSDMNSVLPYFLSGFMRDVQIAEDLNIIQQSINQVKYTFQSDVALLERMNAEIKTGNSFVLPVLRDLTGQDLGESADAWQTWWGDQRGLAYDSGPSEVPTIVEFVVNQEMPLPFHHSCFGVGTLVRTLNGLRPIESVQVGDQVLTEDVKTGGLGFEPVLAVYHNKPTPTLKVTLGGETVVVTSIHRFWKAGQGWVMARELKAGDTVRTVGGVAKVSAIEDAPVQPVFNLEVANGQSFFVGKQGALVHDNSLVQPVTEPFDAPAEISLATSR